MTALIYFGALAVACFAASAFLSRRCVRCGSLCTMDLHYCPSCERANEIFAKDRDWPCDTLPGEEPSTLHAHNNKDKERIDAP